MIKTNVAREMVTSYSVFQLGISMSLRGYHLGRWGGTLGFMSATFPELSKSVSLLIAGLPSSPLTRQE